MAKCFPPMILFEKYEECSTWNLLIHWEYNICWLTYKHKLYKIIEKDLITNKVKFNNKIINVNFPDITGEFKHLTTIDSDIERDRTPDIERCMRLPWLKTAIEKAECTDICCTKYIWQEKDRKTGANVILILYLEDKYIIVLREKPKSYYIKSAYYITTQHELDKKVKSYNNYR